MIINYLATAPKLIEQDYFRNRFNLHQIKKATILNIYFRYIPSVSINISKCLLSIKSVYVIPILKFTGLNL